MGRGRPKHLPAVHPSKVTNNELSHIMLEVLPTPDHPTAIHLSRCVWRLTGGWRLAMAGAQSSHPGFSTHDGRMGAYVTRAREDHETQY